MPLLSSKQKSCLLLRQAYNDNINDDNNINNEICRQDDDDEEGGTEDDILVSSRPIATTVSRRDWLKIGFAAAIATGTMSANPIGSFANVTQTATTLPTSPTRPVSTNQAQTSSAPLPKQQQTGSAATTTTTTTPEKALAPVNLTKVASENTINVSLMCAGDLVSSCITVDRKTFNKIRVTNLPPWIPSWLKPSPKVVREIPNNELLLAAVSAGSMTEMIRTLVLYPIGTVKARIQTDNSTLLRRQGLQRRRRRWRRPQAAADNDDDEEEEDELALEMQHILRRLKLLVYNFQRRFREGRLYAGVLPSLLVSVPCSGVYFGVRDVTKRVLLRALETPTHVDEVLVAVLGALIADVASLTIRTPVDTLAMRLQVSQQIAGGNETLAAGDWFTDAIQRLPAAILTDLPFLLSRIALNGFIASGHENIGGYELIYIATACTCALLTTPFDVARTRILVDSNDDPSDGIDGGSGEGLLRSMKTIMDEGDGGLRNLYAGWLERTIYLGIGRAWLEPLNIILYLGIRDALLLQWFD